MWTGVVFTLYSRVLQLIMTGNVFWWEGWVPCVWYGGGVVVRMPTLLWAIGILTKHSHYSEPFITTNALPASYLVPCKQLPPHPTTHITPVNPVQRHAYLFNLRNNTTTIYCLQLTAMLTKIFRPTHKNIIYIANNYGTLFTLHINITLAHVQLATVQTRSHLQ